MPHNENDIPPHTNDPLSRLAAEVERLTKLNDAYKRRNVSGCVCQISEDGETVEKWCDLHFAVRAERDQLIRAIADHVTARGLLLEAKEKAEAERDALRDYAADLRAASALLSQPADTVPVRADVVRFLNGVDQLEGRWFGEQHKPQYWWRRYLPNPTKPGEGE